MKNLKLHNMVADCFCRLGKTKDKITLMALNGAIGLGDIILCAPDDKDGNSAVTDVVNKVNNVKSAIIALVEAGGAVYLVISIVKAVKGHKNSDDRQLDQGISGIFASVVLMSIGLVVGIFS